jgi:hypothetical protein
MKTKNMTTLTGTNLIRRSPLRRALLLIPLVLACFGLSPMAQAALPEGDLGNGNTVEGSGALQNLSTGIHNNAFGNQTLNLNTTGSYNSATGSQALKANTGDNNTAMGFQSLVINTTGDDNTAYGWRALFHNTTGNGNVAVGREALSQNTDAGDNSVNGANTAVGFRALQFATTAGGVPGDANTGVGWLALQSNTVGQANTGVGSLALQAMTIGQRNSGFGRRAMEFATGNDNVGVGWRAGDNVSTANGVICIGSFTAGQNDNNTTYIGNVGTTIQPFSAGVVDFVTVRLSDNRLGRNASSQRYKEDIKPMDKASEALYQLKPVTYRYKKDIDPNQNLDYGLVAEDVAKIDPKLAIRDGNGQIESVRYMAIYNMMLNELIKEHRKVEDLQSTVAQQQKGMEVLTAQLKEQASQIQKVSAQLEVNKPTPKLVLSNP